jgi:hypothetical protein
MAPVNAPFLCPNNVDIAPSPLSVAQFTSTNGPLTRCLRGYLASDAFAGPYLADQLLLPFALAGGGAFTTVKPSQHSLTAADIIARFTGMRCTFAPSANGAHLVSLEPARLPA